MLKNRLLQVFIRTFYPYGSLRTVMCGYLKGIKFYVAPSMGLTYVLGISNLNWKLFRNKITKGMVILDIGSNRGQMGLFFSKAVGATGKVYCFEPIKQIVDELHRNIHINNMQNVKVYPYALAAKNGTAEFLFADKKSTQGKLSDVETSYVSENANRVEVDIRSLDDLLAEGIDAPQLLKIDVEGAAGLVFEGASDLLDHHPDIYLELHGPDEQKAIGDYLVVRGYKFSDMNGNKILDPVRTWCSPIWCSVLD